MLAPTYSYTICSLDLAFYGLELQERFRLKKTNFVFSVLCDFEKYTTKNIFFINTPNVLFCYYCFSYGMMQVFLHIVGGGSNITSVSVLM